MVWLEPPISTLAPRQPTAPLSRSPAGRVSPTSEGAAGPPPCCRFCVREDQFPIPIQGPNDSRPRWPASASAPDLPVADLVVGRMPRNENAPATWTVLELNRSRHPHSGEEVACPTPLAPLPIFLPRPGRHAGGLRRFLSLDRRLAICQLSPSSDMPSHTLGTASSLSDLAENPGRFERSCLICLHNRIIIKGLTADQ